MYLSGLEILGFKSFPFKTTVDLANGITGVVGPNGCGKTNVLDAIRWVLGEQRISILRGGRMEDVIFSGTRELKPIGMAEVSLHIVNDQQILPTEYHHLTVTRRLYRSGESEYLLNKVPCRLKDITELFADTGMGAHAYSVIESDMVESILSDKAEQRRTLFEEAAGITKYKERKRAALRKMDATEHDLLRLSDILSEVSTQVNSLSRQMKKGERYKYFDDRIKTVGLVLLKENCRDVTLQLRQARDEKKMSQIKLAELQGETSRWELAREDFGAQSLETGEELKRLRMRIEEVSSICYQLEKDISLTEQQISSAEIANKNDVKEIENIKVKVEQLAEEKSSLIEKLEHLKVELADSQQRLNEHEQGLSARLSSLDQARKSGQIYQRDLFEIEGRKNLFEQSRQQLEKEIKELTELLDQARLRLSEQETLKNTVDEALAETETRQLLSMENIEITERSIKELDSQRTLIETQLQKVMTQVSDSRLDVRSIGAHIELFEKMITRYEGYGSGVSAIFADREKRPGMVDTAANLIHTEERYVRAIETALGEAAEYVLADDRTAIDRAIAFLQANNLGRVTFIDGGELRTWHKEHKIARPGGFEGNIIRASEVAVVAPENVKLVELLLGDVLIVADQSSAERLLDLGQGEFRVVTLDGHYYQSRAVHQGGGAKAVSLLGREAELARLRERLEHSQASVDTLQVEQDRLQMERDSKNDQLTQTTRQLERQRQELNELQLESSRLGLETRQIEDQRQLTTEGISRHQEKLNECELQRRKIADDADRLEGDSAGKKQNLQDHNAGIEAMEREVSAAARMQEELRLKVIKSQTELNSLEGNSRRIDELSAELSTQRELRRQSCDTRNAEIVTLNQALVDYRNQLAQKSNEREGLRQQEVQLTARLGELNEKQAEFDQLLKAARCNRELEFETSQRLLVNETELGAKYEDIARQLKEWFGISITDLSLPEPIAEETLRELETELTECREKQQQLGLVNMLALEEYDKEAERERFLSRQIDDLTKAKDDLKTTINRINTTARNMFLETFDKVRTNFQQVFSSLFQGGEADLRLADDSDPLESPVLISARPRGKRLLNISQLSGGEKALTAISLLFAIYLVKPAPFCILDEVDAPLDDANVGRFLRMIKDFSQRTQFILITHNKRTMEQCDRLYGVTMLQPGVSQVVSVDFAATKRPLEVEAMKFEEDEPEDVVTPPTKEVELPLPVDVSVESAADITLEEEPVMARVEEYDDEDDDDEDDDDNEDD